MILWLKRNSFSGYYLFAVFASTHYWFATPTLSFEPITGVASVIDGDSIEIHGYRLRLFGIDAVEREQSCKRENAAWLCGKDAAFALAEKINNSPITCIGSKKDSYKRFLVTCYKNQENLNLWMVKEGWALAYKKYSNLYIDAEIEAKKNHKGLWTSEFQAPWNWRRESRDKRIQNKNWRWR